MTTRIRGMETYKIEFPDTVQWRQLGVTFTLVSHGGQAGTRARTTTITVRLV